MPIIEQDSYGKYFCPITILCCQKTYLCNPCPITILCYQKIYLSNYNPMLSENISVQSMSNYNSRLSKNISAQLQFKAVMKITHIVAEIPDAQMVILHVTILALIGISVKCGYVHPSCNTTTTHMFADTTSSVYCQ